MESLKLISLLTGAFFLAFGLAFYRHFYRVLGAAAGLALWAALRESIVRLPGLREHPGTATVLVLILFCAGGVLLVNRFRKLLAFIAGFGTGIIISSMAASFFSESSLMAQPFNFVHPEPMDLLAGLAAGVLFLLFERFFALLLTSSLGALMCTWAIGGRWTFLLCLLIGLVAQPLIFARFGSLEQMKGEKGKKK
jgi:hypothetical protein